ncbi:DUF2059 domain-containing protein [Marilutibacter maris]|uniref:hypothetical protein n=1 Tax=Marilutibacter maris TaxID=1605891 RepID=UPI000DAA67BA|nr:hypothetical protein [Lysobacter maris]
MRTTPGNDFLRRTAALLLSVAAAAPALAGNRAYEASLDRYFELTYGTRLAAVDVDRLVEDFRAKMAGKPQTQSCPALKRAMDDFADNEFRDAVQGYFGSGELEAQIKDVLRRRLSHEDLEAFIAFADSPAGAAYLRNSQAADSDVQATLKASHEQLMSSPAMKKLVSDMGAKVLPVMLECQN